MREISSKAKTQGPTPMKNNCVLMGERRQRVLSLIQQDRCVWVSGRSESLGISLITIRKDSHYLSTDGLVQRTHGGALPPQSTAMLHA
jgi:DeoR family transcriptional regulator of aga operon